MLSSSSPVYTVALVNTAVWFVLHMLGAGLASRLPLEMFDFRGWLYRTRRWEQQGALYKKLFFIKNWKKFLPDGAAMFKGGFPKKHILPGQAWEYKLGNRSALEWILDQYKEKKPKDPTIAEKFNTYRFADYKDHVIDLLKRVCTVSVETMKIVVEMENTD